MILLFTSSTLYSQLKACSYPKEPLTNRSKVSLKGSIIVLFKIQTFGLFIKFSVLVFVSLECCIHKTICRNCLFYCLKMYMVRFILDYSLSNRLRLQIKVRWLRQIFQYCNNLKLCFLNLLFLTEKQVFWVSAHTRRICFLEGVLLISPGSLEY